MIIRQDTVFNLFWKMLGGTLPKRHFDAFFAISGTVSPTVPQGHYFNPLFFLGAMSVLGNGIIIF